MKKRDWAATVPVCLSIGGCVTVVIFCFLIGFGLNTTVGKEALYLCLLLQALSLAVIWLRNRRAEAPAPSKRMLRLHRVFLTVWYSGAGLLLVALLLGFCGVSYGSPWVRWPCLIGTVLAPIGWVGLLLILHRRKQAALAAAERTKPL